MSDQSFDIGIVGAGVAGSTLASYLAARSGLRIAVIEKSWDPPDEIIGELLQPDGVFKLEDMGLGHIFDEIEAHPVHGYAVYLKGKHFGLDYPADRERNLRGYGFRYGNFVNALRTCARSSKNVSCFEGTVTDLTVGISGRTDGIRFTNEEGETNHITCKLTVVCPGSVSALSKSLHREKPASEGFMAGVVLEDCVLPYESSGHVIMADPAPVLAYPVGYRKVRVLVDYPSGSGIRGKEAIRKYMRDVIHPQLPDELQDAFREAVDKGNIKARGTFQMPGKPVHQDGVLLLGDSLNMRHPLTGAGMTVALTDIRRLVSMITAAENTEPDTLDAIVNKFYRQRGAESASMNIMALALYKAFVHPELKQACFDYLSSGGAKSAGPMTLLSGISRDRGLLLRHFFGVGFSAVGKALKPVPTPKRMWKSLNLLKTTLAIIIPLLRDETPQFYRS